MKTFVGYDNPLGSYPAPLVPIIQSDTGEWEAVYLDDNYEVQLVDVSNCNFTKLSHSSNLVRKRLEFFDYRFHRLFAISESNINFYDIINEKLFFINMLSDENVAKDNLFVRVSYAKHIGLKYLFDKEAFRYEEYLRNERPQYLPYWLEDKKLILQKLI